MDPLHLTKHLAFWLVVTGIYAVAVGANPFWMMVFGVAGFTVGIVGSRSGWW